MNAFITADQVEFEKGNSSQSHNKRAIELYSICREIFNNSDLLIKGITAEEKSRIPDFPAIRLK